jgi:hypothetical protein
VATRPEKFEDFVRKLIGLEVIRKFSQSITAIKELLESGSGATRIGSIQKGITLLAYASDLSGITRNGFDLPEECLVDAGQVATYILYRLLRDSEEIFA